MEHDLEKEALYEVLAQKTDTKIHRVKRKIEAVEAEEGDVQLLGMEQGKPVQFFTSIGYTCEDVALEYSKARYRGDRSFFEITIPTE